MLCYLSLSSVSDSVKNRFWCVWSDSVPFVWLDHSRCSKWRPFVFTLHAAAFATGFVDDSLRNVVPSVSEPLLQLVNVAFRFLSNVR